MGEKLDTDGWCCDDHVVRPGDSPGQWHLYDLHEFNDGPPFATFYADEDAEKRARFCANALHQLADKERELTLATQRGDNYLAKLDNEMWDRSKKDVQLVALQTKLAAANAVCEMTDPVLNNEEGALEELLRRHKKWRKLQGGNSG